MMGALGKMGNMMGGSGGGGEQENKTQAPAVGGDDGSVNAGLLTTGANGFSNLAEAQKDSFTQYIGSAADANAAKPQIPAAEKKQEQKAKDDEFIKMVEYVNAAKKQNELKKAGASGAGAATTNIPLQTA